MADQISASHILVMHEGSERSSATRTREEAQQLIADVKDQLIDGGEFAELAQTHSDCPSAQKGGDLGTFGRGQMVKAFEEVAFGLDIDAVSGIVETSFGYHIIRRTG